MKLLLLLALVGLAASASLRPLSEMSSTTPTLVYQYDTQVATGMEEVSNQFSTVRVRCQVLMKPEEASGIAAGVRRWRIQFRTCEFRQRNNVTESPMPKNLLPMEQLRNLETEQVEATLSQMLSRPFKVDISENQQVIRKVQFGGRDPFWSVNIKKGFLSLLQLNFVPQESDSSEVMAKGQWEKEIDEATVAAVCRTQYSAKRVRFHDFDEQLFRVSKAIDFNNCINPLDGRSGLPGVFFGLTHSQLLEPLNDQPLPQLQTNNQGEFLVQRNPSNGKMLVKRASTKTIYTLAPFAKSWHGTRKTWAIQKLELKGVSDEAPAGSGTEMQEKPEGLRLIFPGEDRQIMGDSLRMSAVGLLMNQLLDENNNVKIVNYEEILTFLRLHVSDEESLREIAKELEEPNRSRHLRIPGVDQLNAAKKKKLLKIFVADLCPQIGSQGSIQFLMNFTHQVMRPVTAQNFVKRVNMQLSEIGPIFIKLGLQSKVQLQSIKLILQTINSDFIRERMVSPKNMPIYTSMWLSLGAMVNVYYSRQGGVEPYVMTEKYDRSSAEEPEYIRKVFQQPWEVRRQHARQSEQFRNQFIRAIREQLQSSDLMKTLALKVTKNCGLFELYNDMRTIFTQKSHNSVNQRVQAVYATQHMLQRHTLPRTISEDPREVLNQQKFVRDHQEFIRHFDKLSRQIQTELLTCFKNPREDPEIRIACYRVLIQSPIKQTVLNSLVQAIMSDVTQQVHEYCVQHMMQIADRPLPRYYRVVKTVRAFVSTIQRDQPATESYSRVLMAQIADQLHKMGLTFETDMIISDKSFSPRWTHLRIDQQVMGRNVPLMEISVRTQGLWQLIHKTVGPRGSFANAAQSVTKLLKRVARRVDPWRHFVPAIPVSDSASFMDVSHVFPTWYVNMIPRILSELSDMELSVAFMGYDAMFVKNTDQLTESIRRIKIGSIFNSLAQTASIFKKFIQFSTVSSSFLMPTTVGTMLDMACMTNIQSEPKINFQKQEMTDTKSKMQIEAEIPVKVQIVRKMGSNMHVLQHSQYYVSKAQVANGFQPKIGVEIQHQESGDFSVSLLQWRPQAQTKILEISNKAFCAVKEISQNAESGPLAFNTVLKEALKPKMVALPTRLNYQPVVNDILDTFFGTRLRIKADFYSNKDIFEAPCALLMAPGKLEIFAGPGSNIAGNSIIRHQVQVSYPIEGLKVPQVQLKVDQVSQDDTDTSTGQKIKVKFSPRRFESGRYPFQIQVDARGRERFIVMDGSLRVPEDLRMTPRSVPLVPSEWIADRQLVVAMSLRKASGESGTLRVVLKTNQRLRQILNNPETTQRDMLGMFPLLVKCINESKESVTEAPLYANPLFTPSCVRQFKKINELNAMDVQFDWESTLMSISRCEICQAALLQLQKALLPNLKEQTPKWDVSTSSRQVKVEIVPSPVDARVLNIDASCPWMQWQWRSVKLPFTPFAWDGVDPLAKSVGNYLKGGSTSCKLMNSHVRTFDKVVYSIPKRLFTEINSRLCPTLLAYDCSPNREFQVFTQAQAGYNFLTVKFKDNKHINTLAVRPATVQVLQRTGSTELKAEVSFGWTNISHRVPEPNQEIEIFSNVARGKRLVISAYQYAGTVMYRIRRNHVEVLVGGRNLRTVEISVSPFYRNKMCGLCGDYNSEKYREFQGPDKVVSSARQMAIEYALPVSDSCEFAQPPPREDWESFGTFDLVHKPKWSNYDLPTTRPSCVIHNERVRTFLNTEVDMLTPAVAEMISSRSCSLKLAAVNVTSQKVRVFLKPSEKKIIVQAGSFKQEISLETPADTVRSSSWVPSGLSLSVRRIVNGIRCDLQKADQRLTVKVTFDKRIVIKATNIDPIEDSICLVTKTGDAKVQKETYREFARKFTDNNEVCMREIQTTTQSCLINGMQLTPLHKVHRRAREPVQILNNELIQELAEKRVPLVLSIDRVEDLLADKKDDVLVTLLDGWMESGRPVQRLTLRHGSGGHVILARVTKYHNRIVVQYRQGGSLRTVGELPDSPREIHFDYSLKFVVQKQSVFLTYKKLLLSYEWNVKPDARYLQVRIMRYLEGPGFEGLGACHIGDYPSVMNYVDNVVIDVDPKIVVQKFLKKFYRQRTDWRVVLTGSEIASIRNYVQTYE